MSFVLRVYGVSINQGKVLISEEGINDHVIWKFPGGGLEYGEGTISCLEREYREETGLNVKVDKHLYTTDFFIESAFHPNKQLISIYYKVEIFEVEQIRLNEKMYDQQSGNWIRFHWVEIEKLSKETFTFPIDQKVGTMIAEWYRSWYNS